MKEIILNIDAIIDETGKALEEAIKHLTEIYHKKYLPAYEFIQSLLDSKKTHLSLAEIDELITKRNDILNAYDEASNFLKERFFPVYEKLIGYIAVFFDLLQPFSVVYKKEFQEIHTDKYKIELSNKNDAKIATIYYQDKLYFKVLISVLYLRFELFASIINPSSVPEGMYQWLQNPLLAIGKDVK